MTTYLVIGAKGAQGGAVARWLVDRGFRVRGFSRSPQGLPSGVEPFAGDLGDARRTAAAFSGVTYASVTLPTVYERDLVARYAVNVAAAASAAGVSRLVFNASNQYPATDTQVSAFETRRAAAVTLQESGVPTTVLRPPIYLDNLATPWVAGPLLRDGILRYPLPADLPVAWLTLDDLAAATVAEFTSTGLDNRVADLGGSEALTGSQLAGLFAATLSRPVRYVAQNIDEFEAGVGMAIGPTAAAAVSDTYRWIAEHANGNWGSPAPGLTAPESWIASQPWLTLAGAAR